MPLCTPPRVAPGPRSSDTTFVGEDLSTRFGRSSTRSSHHSKPETPETHPARQFASRPHASPEPPPASPTPSRIDSRTTAIPEIVARHPTVIARRSASVVTPLRAIEPNPPAGPQRSVTQAPDKARQASSQPEPAVPPAAEGSNRPPQSRPSQAPPPRSPPDAATPTVHPDPARTPASAAPCHIRRTASVENAPRNHIASRATSPSPHKSSAPRHRTPATPLRRDSAGGSPSTTRQ